MVSKGFPNVVTSGQQHNIGEKPTIVLITKYFVELLIQLSGYRYDTLVALVLIGLRAPGVFYRVWYSNQLYSTAVNIYVLYIPLIAVFF